jgi:hypothetical protein
MVDLETLGREAGAAILSIGAVTFDREGVHDTFYRNIDLETCEQAGLEVEMATLAWWLEQDEEAQKVLEGGDDLEAALRDFSTFYDANNAEEIWANSPSFDCEILGHAYDALGIEQPWGFRDERDYRTLRELPGAVWVDRQGTHHNALDDAKHQAKKVVLTLNNYDDAGLEPAERPE